MILKKPYAFLIKNFRIIHLILTFFVGYLIVKTYGVYSFFSRYVSSVYATLGSSDLGSYITLFMFLISILIIAFSLAMYLLMRKKEKPKNLYIALSTYYILYFIGLIVYFMIFRSMEAHQLTIRNAMIIRDVTLIVMLPQFALLVLSLIRAVGFDIKKFNFSKDLKELDISEEDNEEFEFVLGVDSYKYFRYLRRRVREFKYYVLENKFMFTILMSLTCSILLIITILNFTVYNRTYGKNQKVNANNLTLQVNNSYLTNMSYDGTEIAEDTYFLIVNITFTNSSGQSTILELQNYCLETKSGKVYPTLTRSSYFVDFGAGYSKEKIEKKSSSSYILVYEISKKDVAKKYNLKVIDEVEYKAGTIHSKHKNISLKPTVYNTLETVGTYELGKPVTMYDSILQNTSLLVNSFEFKNKLTYQYEACIGTTCRNVTDVVTGDVGKSKTLLVLSGNLKLDKSSTFAENSKTKMSFFDAFVQVRYDNKIAPVVDATPRSLLDQYVLQVDENVAKANNVELIITIRNKQYILKLK
ncbi:MAG TPA: hypothetical protein DCY94_04840 [Firmicutes bacterium]|nr:hypothetical protein [Bacillota bacterium]